MWMGKTSKHLHVGLFMAPNELRTNKGSATGGFKENPAIFKACWLPKLCPRNC